MNDKLRLLYFCLPGPFRSVAASLYGCWLQSWRYGPETEALVQAALDREFWTPDRWKVWQQERLSYILDRAAKHVPYYRELWASRRRQGDCTSWEYLENWPLLTKESVRLGSRAFLADDCDPKKMFQDHTGGTTGTPLTLWVSRKVMREWHAMFEARAKRWNNLGRNESWATLGGQTVVPAKTDHPPFWVRNMAMNHVYFSANHVSQTNAGSYIWAMKRYRVKHIIAYPSSIAFLARETLNQGIPPPKLKCIITMAEPLTSQQREIMRSVFSCEVKETYGMGELVSMATECQAGTLHLWPEVGFVETVNDWNDQPVTNGTSGRLVCTSLLNSDMPLIRYVVGDRGGLSSQHAECKCGRTLPAISAIEGRTSDVLVTRDGRQVFWLNPVFYGLPLLEAQIIQEDIENIRVLYVPARTFDDAQEQVIISRLKERMGDVRVELRKVTTIPRSPNGKFRPVVSRLLSDARSALQSV